MTLSVRPSVCLSVVSCNCNSDRRLPSNRSLVTDMRGLWTPFVISRHILIRRRVPGWSDLHRNSYGRWCNNTARAGLMVSTHRANDLCWSFCYVWLYLSHV